jgi:predicted dehydrogenase
MSLTTAVVGGGTVSDRHLDGLTKLAMTDLVAVCDVDEDRVREKAREYDLKAYTDLEAMLAREDLDWLHLCTPVQTHLDLATTAIKEGVAVQIEKPVTETVAEAEELARVADRHDVPVSVVHNHNFDPAMRTAREAIERGEIGDVRSVDMLYAGETWPDQVKRGAWAHDLPGGEFEEGFPHPIYMLLNLGGHPTSADDVDASTQRRREYDGEFQYDGVQFQFTSEDEVLCSGTIVASDVPHKTITVHGDDGSIVVDVVSQTVTRLDRDYESSPVMRALTNVDHVYDRVKGSLENVYDLVERKRDDSWEVERDAVPHYYQFDAEAAALIQGRDLPSPLEEARWTIQIMEEIRASAAQEPSRVVAQQPADQD